MGILERTAMTERPLYSSRIIDTFIKYLGQKYPLIDANEILSNSGIKPYQVADQGHWFTQEEVDQFYEEILKKTGNKDIAREAGRFAASADSLGFIRQYILGLVGPGRAYELIGKFSSFFTKSSDYVAKRIGKHRVEITVTPHTDVHEKAFQCENRVGHLEALAHMFNYRFPAIEHPECMFRGGSSCKYIVTWQESYSGSLEGHQELFHDLSPHSHLRSSCVSRTPGRSLRVLLPFAALVFFALTIYIMRLENTDLNAALSNLQGSSDKLLDQLNSRHNDSLLIHELGLALNKKSDLDDIFREVIQAFQNRLDYDRGLILLPNKKRPHWSSTPGLDTPSNSTPF